jgi:nitrite reductase/ring-hydroxylating ferredoxin subunit
MSDCSRRSFLQTSCGLGGVIAAIALLPADLKALPMHWVEGAPVGAGGERAFPIPAADSVNVDREVAMILVRAQGKIFAFALSCPHEHASVKWIDKEGRFACTKHDSKYLPDGKYISGRATRHMDRFPIRKDGGNVVINLEAVFHSDLDAAGWSAAEVAV